MRVVLSKLAQKQATKTPQHITLKLALWSDGVQTRGLEEIRKIASYHDEPLHGKRKGQRSIRLNRAYRAIYVIKHAGALEFISVEEVTKHGY